MTRTWIPIAAGLLSGVLLGAYVASDRRAAEEISISPGTPVARISSAREVLEASRLSDTAKDSRGETLQLIDALAEILDAEVAERRALEERLERLSEEVGTLQDRLLGTTVQVSSAVVAETDAQAPAMADPRLSRTERALIGAGIEADVAAYIKRRHDEVDLQRAYLHDQATREGWINSPRYAQEMSELADIRRSVRDEIGADSYDRYLYAMGRPNRVTVDDVLENSPAQQAGLQPGDVLLSYGGERLFNINELIEVSRSGQSGKIVMLEVIRDGQRMHIYLPRGPLGIRSGGQHVAPATE